MTTINTIEDLIRLLDENPDWLEAVRSRLLTRQLLEMPQRLAGFIEVTNRRLDTLEATVQAQQSDIETLKSDVKSIRVDLGYLKGGHARASAIREASAIACDMGLKRVRNLTFDDLQALLSASDTADIPPNELISFRRADLVMEATDQSGETCYLAVEISFTVDSRDTTRATRNAAFLSRFTGRPCYAAVAGINRDRRVAEVIDSGSVYWRQM